MSDLASALNTQGFKYLTSGNRPLALDFLRASIAHDPRSADAYNNLGVALFLEKRLDEAITAFRQSLTLRPDHQETLLNLGCALAQINDHSAAEEVLLQVDLPLAHILLGAAYFELGKDALAIEHTQKGLAQDPNNIVGHNTLRGVYQFGGDEAKAWAACNELVRLAPDYPDHYLKRSLVMLTFNDPDGWAEHECRYDTSPDNLSTLQRENPYFFSKLYGKRWTGQKTDHLLIQTEQGFGDIIQFLRFLPLAAERCNRISLYIPPSLRRIATQAFGHLNVDVCQDIPQDFDHYCLIMSLGYLLNCTTAPPQPPYLSASPHKYGEIRRLPGLKVGLCWSGSEKHAENHYRRMSFEKIARLLDLPVHFVSLQYPCDVDLMPYRIIDPRFTPAQYDGNLLVDWTETAALIDTLDLVISTDTAVPHLAGALGKPVWLLNRYNTDWRWMLHRSDSPWYPSMRIFRQPKMGDWDSVIDMVYAELARL